MTRDEALKRCLDLLGAPRFSERDEWPPEGELDLDERMRRLDLLIQTRRPIVIVESPFAGDLERNARYLDACLSDSLRRGEAPFASHGLYTRSGVLRDAVPAERELGVQAGFAFRRVASLTVVYADLGISGGMQRGIDDANEHDCRIEYRKLGGEWKR
jgi:hypothetical protein